MNSRNWLAVICVVDLEHDLERQMGGKQRSSKVMATKNSRESLVRYQEVQITISEMRKYLDCSFAVCMDNPARTSIH